MIRNWLFRFLFGSDVMAVSMLELLNLRKAAAKRSLKNLAIKMKIAKEQEKLAHGREVMYDLKSNYDTTKEQLEDSYNFGFEVE